MCAAAALTAVVIAPSAFAEAPPAAERAFLERTSLAAADEKCGYFTDMERLALESGRLQARGALLRGGFDLPDISRGAEEVSRFAMSRMCGDPEFLASANKLKSAFEAFLGQISMRYPGSDSEWLASRSKWDTWRVVQSQGTGKSEAVFGMRAPPPPDRLDLAGGEQTSPQLNLSLVYTAPASAPEPVGARIYLRDTAKWDEPWLGNIFTGEKGTAPRGIAASWWATSRFVGKPNENGRSEILLTFPRQAQAALETLDPREMVEIEIIANPRATSRTPLVYRFEVGDFAAAHAFARLPNL